LDEELEKQMDLDLEGLNSNGSGSSAVPEQSEAKTVSH
jgi:hypothetical protein